MIKVSVMALASVKYCNDSRASSSEAIDLELLNQLQRLLGAEHKVEQLKDRLRANGTMRLLQECDRAEKEGRTLLET